MDKSAHELSGPAHEPSISRKNPGFSHIITLPATAETRGFYAMLDGFNFRAGDRFVIAVEQVSGPVEIRQVTNRREMGIFINLPWQVYRDDPCWVPPLRIERRWHFSTFNPYFKYAEWRAWLAWRQNRCVGRICAQVDQIHRKYHGPDTGHFGLLEAEEDPDIFSTLLNTAEAWLAGRKAVKITGPFNFSINQECGVLVDGFDTPPMILMPHSRKWYGPYLEQQGYRPAMDLLAFWIDTSFEASKVMKNLERRFSNRVRLRTLRRDRFNEELEIIRGIFNDAWANNWGFIPFSREEFNELGSGLKYIVPDDFIQVAEVENKPAAFVVVLPNLNEVLHKLNGKLLPSGWLKLIFALKRKGVTTARVPLMGVCSRYQNTPLGITLAFLVCDAARHAAARRGISGVELSWILDNNKGMLSILDNIGSKAYKRYRVYEKTI